MKAISNSLFFPRLAVALYIQSANVRERTALRENTVRCLQHHHAVTPGRWVIRKKLIQIQTLSKNFFVLELQTFDVFSLTHLARELNSPNTSMSDPEPICASSKDANPKDSLDAPVVLGMGSKTILPKGH